TYTVVTRGAVTSATIVQGAGLPDIPLRADGPGRWTARIPVSAMVREYQQGWTHGYVGQLTFNGARTGGYIVSANIRDGGMPDVPVQALAADAQSSPHVFNLRWDDLYTGISVPPGVVRRFYNYFGDDYDWIATVQPASSPDNRFFVHVRNEVAGIGVDSVDRGLQYGSAARLKGLIHFPLDPYFDMAQYAASHEIGHQWINFLRLDPTLAKGAPHWPISTLAYGIMGWSLPGGAGGSFPYRLDANGDGTYRVTRVAEPKEFNTMELYLMGLLPADSVGEFVVFENQDQLAELRAGGTLRGPVRTLRASDVIALHGPRKPAYGQAQKDFRLAVIVLSRGRLLTHTEMAFFDHLAARGEATTELPYAQGLVFGIAKPFGPATGGRARLTTRLR
ncbi:MAG TPA: hypothetical protein VFQ39_01215, partial [Longimicrobium sp.]|nr:hypothetical protein [Longimicrobium sp.]